MNGSVATSERLANRDRSVEMTNSAPAASTASGILHAAQRLGELARSIEQFLTDELRRLDTLLAQRATARDSENLSQADRAAFLQRQLAWDREKNEELQRIEQEREQLAEAWTRVESEQRRLLAEEALWRAQANTKQDASAPSGAEATGESTGSSHTGRKLTRQPGLPQGSEGVSREAVLVDYEKLKSDVQRHARRLRRGK